MNRDPYIRGRVYETSQLLPYLGNKRALIPCLRELFRSLRADTGGCVFLDPFAGTGSVSRLARSLGMTVRANDWEPYSYAVNRVWLELRPSDLDRLFREEGGIGAVLKLLNSFHPDREDRSPHPEPEPYMARWYAPSRTARADWRTERLFYTRENAVFLDRVREYIARRGSLEEKEATGDSEESDRWLLLALLLLEAATHANTSGVFKAFHKGFGGHGKDALTRILGAMELELPILPEAEPARVFREDAARFVRRFPADIAYLDPPYNQHQYGSNYHILNTLVLWRREPVPLDTGPDGRLLRKAGIPESWRETWSPYCGRTTAREALASLLDSLDARTVVFSYNTEGIVEPEELYEMLARRWDVNTEILDYVLYRGGRQSSSRRVRNHELVFIGRSRPSARSPSSGTPPERLGAELRLRRLLASRFDPGRIRSAFRTEGDAVLPAEGRGAWRMWRFHRFTETGECDFSTLDPSERERILSGLESCEIGGNAEAAMVLAGMAGECVGEMSGRGIRDAREAVRQALTALRKLAHPRYTSEYRTVEHALAMLARESPPLRSWIEDGLQRIGTLREARLAGSRKPEAAAREPR